MKLFPADQVLFAASGSSGTHVGDPSAVKESRKDILPVQNLILLLYVLN